MSDSIKSSLSQIMKQSGFKQKGSTWYVRRDACWLLVGLQKSQYDDLYYINLAVWMDAAGGVQEAPPKPHVCHISTRLKPPQEEAYGWRDEEAGLLQEAMVSRGIPFLEKHSTIDGIRQEQREGRHSGVGISGSLRKLIE
jgi:hypothetical protein